MGTRGVTALTHYDQVHNFFTQIYGRKRFLLVRGRDRQALLRGPCVYHPSWCYGGQVAAREL